MYGEFENVIRATKTSSAGLVQDVFVRSVEKKITVNSAATAATTATRMRVNNALLNSLNPGGNIGLLGLRIAHSTVKKVDMTVAAMVATAKR